MNNKVPINCIESALKDWQTKEERFGKLFSSDILKNKPFLQEKLKYFERYRLNMEGQQVGKKGLH